MLVEQAQQLRRLGRGGLATLKGRIKQGFALRDGVGEAPARSGAKGFPFLSQERFLVGRVQDRLVAIVGAAVAGNLSGSIENADSRL